MIFTAVIFWISIVALFHSYLLYPLIIRLVAAGKSAHAPVFELEETLPSVSILMSAYNEEKVIGIHYLGPSAGEVISGFGLAMKLGLKKSDLDKSLGIHPTVSEDLFNLTITKRSGEEYIKTDC